jgi:hypothetical protein
MKKLLYTFLVSLFGGFLALFMHNFYYDHSNNIITKFFHSQPLLLIHVQVCFKVDELNPQD